MFNAQATGVLLLLPLLCRDAGHYAVSVCADVDKVLPQMLLQLWQCLLLPAAAAASLRMSKHPFPAPHS